MVKLKCKLGVNTIREVEINPLENLNVLLKKLNISGEKTQIIYKGMNFPISNILTFRQIGLESDNIINITKKAIAGGGFKITLKCKLGVNTIKEVEVDISDQINVLLKKLNITDNTAKFMYNSNIYSISSSMKFYEIDICDNDIITFVGGGPLIKVECIFGTNIIKKVEVKLSDQINVLLKMLDIKDKRTNLVYQGCTYGIATIWTFEEIGILSDCHIFINNQAISG